jgi:hypothetical protein
MRSPKNQPRQPLTPVPCLPRQIPGNTCFGPARARVSRTGTRSGRRSSARRWTR